VGHLGSELVFYLVYLQFLARPEFGETPLPGRSCFDFGVQNLVVPWFPVLGFTCVARSSLSFQCLL
jgi:hypothetical protein